MCFYLSYLCLVTGSLTCSPVLYFIQILVWKNIIYCYETLLSFDSLFAISKTVPALLFSYGSTISDVVLHVCRAPLRSMTTNFICSYKNNEHSLVEFKHVFYFIRPYIIVFYTMELYISLWGTLALKDPGYSRILPHSQRMSSSVWNVLKLNTVHYLYILYIWGKWLLICMLYL